MPASRQSPKQKVSGTGAATSASDSLVGLGFVDGASNVDRACNRSIRRLPAFRTESDLGSIWVVAVLLFERFLKRSKIHGTSFFRFFADSGPVRLAVVLLSVLLEA